MRLDGRDRIREAVLYTSPACAPTYQAFTAKSAGRLRQGRSGLGIKPENDPLEPGLTNKKRDERLAKLKEKCNGHVLGRMREQLAKLLPTCTIEEEDDPDRMSLRVKYPSLLKADGYLKPWVKIECGARGALEPTVSRNITPYIQDEFGKKIGLMTNSPRLKTA